jgi:hypothetical protein
LQFVALPGGCAVKGHVQRQHVYARLAEKTEVSALDMLIDKLTHLILRHVARFGNARHLERGSLRGNVRIEPAA